MPLVCGINVNNLDSRTLRMLIPEQFLNGRESEASLRAMAQNNEQFYAGTTANAQA